MVSQSSVEKEQHLNSPLLSKSGNIAQAKTHRDAEEESQILKIEAFSYSRSKEFLFWILVVMTGGLLYLFDFWFMRLHLFLRYSRAHPGKATHLLIKTPHYTDLVETKEKETLQMGKVLTFEHHYLPYYYDGLMFQPLFFETALTYSSIIEKHSSGINNQEELQEKKELFGKCQLEIPERGFLKLFFDELLHPFYIFQIYSCALWYWDDYRYYASAIVIITTISLTTSLVQTKKNLRNLKNIAFYSCKVETLRNNQWESLESSELVPGDIIEVPQGSKMPCDAVVLSGSCVMEEGMLTGESVPVLKDHLPNLSGSIYNIELDKRYSLYEGTCTVQVISKKNQKVTALVTRTGFMTMKGKLVRSILYPKPNKFKFYEDSMKFIAVLAVIAICGFCVCLPYQLHMGVPVKTMIDRSLDLFTVTVPPALPAVMTVGTAFAINRLRKRGIFCISPPRVNVSGKIGVFCFDKTGTLTEDGMELMGVEAVYQKSLLQLNSEPSSIESSCGKLIECMGTCHSLTKVNGEVIGDTQDLQIFNATGYRFEEPDEETHETVKAHIKTKSKTLELMHIFHFNSKLKRMGVLVKDSQLEFFEKGAPEAVIQRCSKETIPSNLNESLRNYTQSGFRVLACAHKTLNEPVGDLRSAKLEELETNLEFLGLIVLQNKVKPASEKTIAELEEAGISSIMATGDAILTGISVARECKILKPEPPLFLGELEGNSVHWTKFEIDSEIEERVDAHEIPDPPWKVLGTEGHYALALTGPAFLHISKNAELGETEHIVALKMCIEKCKVYARMSPEHKTLLVEHLQENDHLVGMCGDGANDCGALKTADIGISLSEAETSIAAPFTSSIPDISCVIQVLQEGRCALSTSLESFKFMALYSMIQFTTVTTLYMIGSNLKDIQFLTIDLFTILPLALFMSYTGPYHKLSRKQPTASLISVPILTSVIGQSVLSAIVQLSGYWIMNQMSFFTPIDFDPNEDVEKYYFSWENSLLFLLSWFEYQAICIVFSMGKPFKKPFYSNIWLTSTSILLMAWTIVSIFYPGHFFREIVQVSFT